MSRHLARSAPWGSSNPGVVVLAVLASGCTWISQAKFDEALQKLDNDGDKITVSDGDCDDTDPKIYPGATEVWYDGIDSDCGKDDDFDADKDGWVPSEHEGAATQGVSGSGGLRAGDCDDANPDINPTAFDDWYDGVDADCAGNDDNDADGDGFASAEHGGDDCFDADGNVYPGATDVWLDGVDSDCAGNSDYDEDGDGYAPTGLGNRATEHAPDAPVVPEGDCDDTDPEVNAFLDEVYYDGKDNDCDPATADLDQDGDGFELGGTTEDDCDDLDPTAFPGGDEVVSDAVDHDCDGGTSTFADLSLAESGPLFDTAGLADFDGLRDIQIAAGPTHLWLALGADHLTLPLFSGDEEAEHSIVALGVPLEDSTRGIVRRQYLLFHPSEPTRYSLDDTFAFSAVAAPGSGGTTADLLLTAHGLQTTAERLLRISGYNDRTDQTLGASFEVSGATPYSGVGVILGLGDRVHAVGCIEGGDLDIMSGLLDSPSDADLTTGATDTTATLSGAGAARCALDAFDDPDISIALVPSSGSATRMVYDRDDPGAGLALDQTYTGITADEVDLAEGGTQRAVVHVDSSGSVHVTNGSGTVQLSGVTADGPVHALATGDSRGTSSPDYILSGVQATGTAWFAVGNNSTGYTAYDLAPADGGVVTDAAAWLDADGRLHTFIVSDGGVRYGSAVY